MAVTFRNLQAADLVSAGVPDRDVNGIVDAPATVNDALGRITIHIANASGATRDTCTNGAVWLLNHHPSWVGNGLWGYLIKITPIDLPNVDYPIFGFGFADQNGDPTVTANMACAGLGSWVDADGPGIPGLGEFWSTTGLCDSSGFWSFAGHSPSMILRYIPFGVPGNAANVGAQPAQWGSLIEVGREDPNNLYDEGFVTPRNLPLGVAITGAFRPFLFAGWNWTDPADIDWTLQVQTAVIPAFPTGTF